MPDCSKCGKHLTRTRRTPFERPFYSAAYRCHHCDNRLRIPHTAVHVQLTFLFSRHTHCIKCGNAKVRRHGKRDRIDTISKHPVSTLMMLTGAPLYRCLDCRIQYYDWRRPEPGPAKPEPQDRDDDPPTGSTGSHIVGLS